MLLNLCTQIRLSSLFIMWFEMKCSVCVWIEFVREWASARAPVNIAFTKTNKTANGSYALFIQYKWYIVSDNDAEAKANALYLRCFFGCMKIAFTTS